MKQLPNNSSVFSAEMIAIDLALDIITAGKQKILYIQTTFQYFKHTKTK